MRAAALRSLAAALAVVLAACTAQPAAPEPTDRPTAAVTAATQSAGAGIGGVATRTVAFGDGLLVDLPASWTLGASGNVNMMTQRLLVAGNGDIASLPVVPNNGDVDAGALAPGRFVLELEVFCRLSCMGPESETPLPLDWSKAAPLYPALALPPDRHQLALGFRWFDQPMFLVALWADPAPAEVALLPAIARSIRPSVPPPSRGEYRGWDALGPSSGIPVGAVRLEPLPAGAVIRNAYSTWDNEPFFVVRGRQHIYAFTSRPLVERRCVIAYDAPSDHFRCTVDGRTYEWTRFGRYLGPEPLSDLAQHGVIERDGVVWVHYVGAGLLVPSVRDEAAEY